MLDQAQRALCFQLTAIECTLRVIHASKIWTINTYSGVNLGSHDGDRNFVMRGSTQKRVRMQYQGYRSGVLRSIDKDFQFAGGAMALGFRSSRRAFLMIFCIF
ncbi:hypothetical protein [Pseudomonas lini]